MPATKWDEAQACEVVGTVVRDNIRLFDHFPDIGPDDLFQDLIMHVRRTFPAFEPRRQRGRSFTSWVYMVAQRKLINKARDRARRATWDAAAAQGREYVASGATAEDGRTRGGEPDRRVPIVYPVEVIDPPARLEGEGEVFDGEIVGGDGEPTIAEWLTAVHARACRRLNEPRHRARRHGFTAGQEFAAGALMERLKLSSRGAVLLFECRPDLCLAIGFNVIPSHKWFWDARAEVTVLLEKN